MSYSLEIDKNHLQYKEIVTLYFLQYNVISGGKRGHTPHLNEKLKSINIC